MEQLKYSTLPIMLVQYIHLICTSISKLICFDSGDRIWARRYYYMYMHNAFYWYLYYYICKFDSQQHFWCNMRKHLLKHLHFISMTVETIFEQDVGGRFQKMIDTVYQETSSHLLEVFHTKYKFMEHLKVSWHCLVYGSTQGLYGRALSENDWHRLSRNEQPPTWSVSYQV